MWQVWLNGLIGLWLILSAFLGFEGPALIWNLVVSGIVVAILGFWSAGAKN
ncbi:MAG: SPW repeat protein [bacterium]